MSRRINVPTLSASEKKALDLVAIDRELGLRSLHDFIKMAWSVVDPASFSDGWHIRLICDYLERVFYRKIRNLVINIPPRHCKSSIVSVMFPVWAWVKDPSVSFYCFSYAMSLSERDSVKCRRLIESDWFKKRWGEIVQLETDQNQKRRYATTKGGVRIISSVGGVVTGEGGDFLIVDDAHNSVEGESEAIRRATIQWWKEGVSTRLNDERTGCKLIIQQRVHEDDLAGQMIQSGYEHLVLPAEYEHDHPFVHPDDPRTVDGELLWPTKFGPDELSRLKMNLGTYAAAGQLQQRPAPREGGMFQDSWFDYIDREMVPSGGISVRGWDIAASTVHDAAYTCSALIRKVGDIFYVMEVTRFRLTAGEVENRIRAIVEADGLQVRLQSFPQDPGAGGKLAIRNLLGQLVGFPVRSTLESGSKEARATALAAQMELGRVKFVRGQWNEQFKIEAKTFPNGRYKDQIDAASRAFHEILSLTRTGLGHVGGTPSILNSPVPLYIAETNTRDIVQKPSISLDVTKMPVISGPRGV